MEQVPIQADFAPLRPYLQGSPRQFLTWQGDTYCVRAHPDDLGRKNKALNPCEGCPHFEAGCELAGEFPVEAAYKNQQDGSISGMEPHTRRGIGMEGRPFLVLLFQPGHSHRTLPKTLWDNPHADKAMDEANLHFLLTNPRTSRFHTIKGQLRFYGTEEEFLDSAYAEYLQVFDAYEAAHHPISMDKSAIEPRVCTVVTEEPRWLSVFQGSPKAISREIALSAEPEARPRYVYEMDGRTFCYLEGELDKASFTDQCGKCPLRSLCQTKVDHLKNVAGDWHAINAEGFFGAAFTETTDAYVRKQLRGDAKVGGLASIYGGSKFTLSRALNMTEDEANSALVRFFSTLGVARRYMDNIKTGLRTHGFVETKFGRRRDMRRWSDSQAMMPVTRTEWETLADGQKVERAVPVMDRVQLPDGSVLTNPDGSYVLQPRMVPDQKKRWKDFGYAERTGLNYPIQGTAAELMKMAMIEIDHLIQRHGWNPLVGLAIPQRMEVGRGAYRRLLFALLSTVHDELLYLIRNGEIDQVIPLAYTAMQLGQVMKALRTGFSLELDVEYDKHRAWTAGQSVPAARIYLLNRLRSAGGAEVKPNAALVGMEHCTDALVAELNAYQSDADPDPKSFRICVGEGYLEPPTGPFSERFVRGLLERTRTPAHWAVMPT